MLSLLARLVDRPLVVLLFVFALLYASALMGRLLRGQAPMGEDHRHDYSVILAAVLTLLGLVIGFTFSMATSRFDLRKNFEEEEANAIGTEYLRAEVLPDQTAASLKGLLLQHLDRRILYYNAFGPVRTPDDPEDARLTSEMWSQVRAAALKEPTPVAALAVSGLNDVLNSQGYAEASWRNRIPVAAWELMAAIAVLANGMVGYGTRSTRVRLSLAILPLVVAVSFLFIADIDSPRGGLIRVPAKNLGALSRSLPTAPPAVPGINSGPAGDASR